MTWIKKLQLCNNNYEEMVLRNSFLYYLLTCVKNAELRPPFNEPAPCETLARLQSLLVNIICIHEL